MKDLNIKINLSEKNYKKFMEIANTMESGVSGLIEQIITDYIDSQEDKREPIIIPISEGVEWEIY